MEANQNRKVYILVSIKYRIGLIKAVEKYFLLLLDKLRQSVLKDWEPLQIPGAVHLVQQVEQVKANHRSNF